VVRRSAHGVSAKAAADPMCRRMWGLLRASQTLRCTYVYRVLASLHSLARGSHTRALLPVLRTVGNILRGECEDITVQAMLSSGVLPALRELLTTSKSALRYWRQLVSVPADCWMLQDLLVNTACKPYLDMWNPVMLSPVQHFQYRKHDATSEHRRRPKAGRLAGGQYCGRPQHQGAQCG
jgi:hypothetical protein